MGSDLMICQNYFSIGMVFKYVMMYCDLKI